MFKNLFGKNGKEEVGEKILEGNIEVSQKAVAGSSIDRRLIVKTGKRGKQEFMKSPCVGECADCPRQFKPAPYEGKTYCSVYIDPQAKWTGKTCPFMYEPPAEREQQKINPIKASRRRVKQSSAVATATGSKESEKKNKKKTERQDSR